MTSFNSCICLARKLGHFDADAKTIACDNCSGVISTLDNVLLGKIAIDDYDTSDIHREADDNQMANWIDSHSPEVEMGAYEQ